MKMFVIHQCERALHGVPLSCACYAISEHNAQLRFCEDSSIQDLDVHHTAFQVKFRTGMGVSFHDVTRLWDQEGSESPNARC